MKQNNVKNGALRSAGTLLLRLAAKMNAGRTVNRAQAGIDDRTARSLERWLSNRSYRKNQTLDEVAHELGVSASQLSYYCSKVIGTPFPVWRKNLRIADAKELIAANPDTSLALVGRMVGIPDKSNFKKLFTLVTGMTPGQWRDECKSLLED